MITSIAPSDIATPTNEPVGINISGSGFSTKQVFDIDMMLGLAAHSLVDYSIENDGTIIGHVPNVLPAGSYTLRIRYTDSSSDEFAPIVLASPVLSGPGGATYDITTPIGQVRLLAFDTLVTNAIFSDQEIAFFLQINNQTVRLAAAQAIERIAMSETYLQKHIKTLDIERDGPGEAEALMSIANKLRQEEFNYGDDFSGLFDYAELVYDQWGMRELLLKQYLRQIA